MTTDPTAPPIRVVVVDDQPLVRTGNALILDSDDSIAVIGEAGTGIEALAVIEREPPEVVLMDVRMPGMDGLEATRRIVSRHPNTRVIVLTTFDLDEYAFGSLRAGASAFLLKSTTPAALAAAVHTVAAGDAVVDPRLTARLIAHYVATGDAAEVGQQGPHPPQPEQQGTQVTQPARWPRPPRPAAGVSPDAGTAVLARLSPREREVFGAIVAGLTNPEIAAALTLAPTTVKSHVNAIFAKLGLRDRVHAVILGHELGLPELRGA